MFLMKLNLEECGLWWEAAMICEVCVVEGQQGDFSPWCAAMMLPTSLLNGSSRSPPWFPSCSYSFSAVHKPCGLNVDSLFVRGPCVRCFSLLAATTYMARRLHVSQAFSPSLVPTVWPLTPWVPAQFELMQDEAMQNLGRWAVSRHRRNKDTLSHSLSFFSTFRSFLWPVIETTGYNVSTNNMSEGFWWWCDLVVWLLQSCVTSKSELERQQSLETADMSLLKSPWW